ncbi:MAG: lipid-A-disaccharide synthase [Paracoccaceae bacterium]
MKVFIVAGEASGDLLGAALMRGLSQLLEEPPEFIGVGGEEMLSEGLSSLFPMHEISIMGISEILSNYMSLRKRIRQTARAVLDEKPDVLITVDLPEFNLRVAERVRKQSHIPIVHYVAPTVWAWRPKRAAHMAKFVDHVLALFPFEPRYMREAGMSCDFVGHPIAQYPVASEADAAIFREDFDLSDDPIILCLPGSRRSEVKRLTPIFTQALSAIRERHPNIQFVMPLAPAVAAEVNLILSIFDLEVKVIDPRDISPALAQSYKRAAFKAADIALAASGTVSLELAANSVPMVIGYDMGWLSRQIIGRMVKTDTVTLVNLVSETRHIQEYIGPKCTASNLAEAILDVMRAPNEQIKAMETTLARLGRDEEAPGLRAARSVVGFLNQNGQQTSEPIRI